MFDIENTEWRESAKGNYWCEVRGTLLVVGQQKRGPRFWVLVADEFLPEDFETLADAQCAAEAQAKGLPRRNIFASGGRKQ